MTAALPWKGHEFSTVLSGPTTQRHSAHRQGWGFRYGSPALRRALTWCAWKPATCCPLKIKVNVAMGAAAAADFKLEWINPGPVRLESEFDGDIVDPLSD